MTLPSLSAEMAVLGSCLIAPEALDWANHYVPEEEFLSLENRKIFEVMKRMKKLGTAVDSVTLQGHMTDYEKRRYWETVIGLSDAVKKVQNYPHYAEVMHKQYVVHELNKRYDKVRADPFDVESQKEIRRLWDSLTAKQNSIVSVRDMSDRYLEIIDDRRSGKIMRLMSGFEEFDAVTGGFQPGTLAVVGARTSTGKTAFLLNLCRAYLNQKRRVLFVSAEMLFEELMDRLVAMDSTVFISKLRTGNLTEIDQPKVRTSVKHLGTTNLWCLEGGRMGVNRIRNAVETVNPEIVFVDFIQRFTPPSYNISRVSYLSDVANELKDLAKEHRIVTIAASQLNRSIEKEGRSDPQLSDYRDSGGIEESADYSIMLVAEKDNPMLSDRRITVHVNKARNGPLGKVEFLFQKPLTLFKPALPAGIEESYLQSNGKGRLDIDGN